MENSINYEKEIEKLWNEYQVEKILPNIGLLGSTGSGKSSLINNIFGIDAAKVSDVKSKTQDFQMYEGKKYGASVNLLDSKGYELTDVSTSFMERFKGYLAEKNSMHLVWVCISATKKRVEDIDLKIIGELLQIQSLKERVFCVITKCDEDDEEGSIAKNYKKILYESFPNLQIFEVSTHKDFPLELDNLLEESSKILDNDDLRKSFIASQIPNLELKRKECEKILLIYSGLAGLVGAIPISISDSKLIIPIQLKMLVEIADIYNLDFNNTLLEGVVLKNVVTPLGKKISKFLKGKMAVVGSILDGVSAGAITYGLGKGIIELMDIYSKKILAGEKVDIIELFNSNLIQDIIEKTINNFSSKKDKEKEEI